MKFRKDLPSDLRGHPSAEETEDREGEWSAISTRMATVPDDLYPRTRLGTNGKPQRRSPPPWTVGWSVVSLGGVHADTPVHSVHVPYPIKTPQLFLS